LPSDVVGTLVTVGNDRLELIVEKAIEPSPESAAQLVGQTLAVVVDARTDKPAELKVGDRVELWFTEEKGRAYAVRVVEAADASEPSKGGAAQPDSSAPPDAGAPTAAPPVAEPEQPPVPGAAPNAAAGSVAPSESAATAAGDNSLPAPTTQPVNHQANARKQHTKAAEPPAPQPVVSQATQDAATGVTAAMPPVGANQPAPTSPVATGSVETQETVGNGGAETPPRIVVSRSDSPLPFIGLGAVAALVALAMLYLTLRGRYLDFGLRAEKGGVR
jgi:hypothetical protein